MESGRQTRTDRVPNNSLCMVWEDATTPEWKKYAYASCFRLQCIFSLMFTIFSVIYYSYEDYSELLNMLTQGPIYRTPSQNRGHEIWWYVHWVHLSLYCVHVYLPAWCNYNFVTPFLKGSVIYQKIFKVYLFTYLNI